MTEPLKDVSHFVRRFEEGYLQDSYYSNFSLAPARSNFAYDEAGTRDFHSDDVVLSWFNKEDLDRYGSIDGYYPRGDEFEFTVLWYAILENYMDCYDAGNWSVEHGGLRFEYLGNAKGEMRPIIETIIPLAYKKYVEVTEELLRKGQFTPYVYSSSRKN